jgi:hypothetical protein
MNSDPQVLIRHFAAIGAELRFGSLDRRGGDRVYDLDVIRLRRSKDQAFLISCADGADLDFLVLNRNCADRHLLLMARVGGAEGQIEKHRYLCGHDEREWFAAAVPNGSRGVTNVAQAKEALKPALVRAAQSRQGVRRRDRNRRRNKGSVRQGEWFFVPAPELLVPEVLILHREPIRRGRGNPHMAEQAFRRGGTTVYVSRPFPNGVDQETFDRMMGEDPKKWGRFSWRVMRRNPEVYCRGRVTHPDHATINLPGWHRVVPNTEGDAFWFEHMAFLD